MVKISIATALFLGCSLFHSLLLGDEHPSVAGGEIDEAPANEAEKSGEDLSGINILKGILPEPSPTPSPAGGAIDVMKGIKGKLQGVHGMLGEGVVDKRAQTPQEEVLKQLEAWIEASKPKAKQPEEDSQAASTPGATPGDGTTPGKGERAVDKEMKTGAMDSRFRSGSNAVGELRKFLDERATSSWGKLPEKERETMIQEMKEKLPHGSASWIEGFSRRLAGGEAK